MCCEPAGAMGAPYLSGLRISQILDGGDEIVGVTGGLSAVALSHPVRNLY